MLLLICLSTSAVFSQGKLPPFSFKANSTEFADANFEFSQDVGFTETDTITDEMILASLAKILDTNPDLRIMLIGHTALGEEDELGLKRAKTVQKKLVKRQIDRNRIQIENRAHAEPLVSDEIVFSLEEEIEREEAMRRNRRVEVRVIKPGKE